MKETFYIGGYWPARQESAEECARRAETFFRLLSLCDPIYARWFEQAGSLKKALQLQFEPTYDTFMRFFGRRTYREGWDGFRFSAWTGHKEDGHGGMVTLRCGSAAKSIPNSCLLHLSHSGPAVERVLTVPVLKEMMRALVLAWKPEWAVVTSPVFRDSLSEDGRAGTFVGGMTYFSQGRGEVPVLPRPVGVEPVEDKGMLVLLDPEHLATSSSRKHVTLGRRVQDVLQGEGLLKPVVSRRRAG
jgi:hypothetical protein